MALNFSKGLSLRGEGGGRSSLSASLFLILFWTLWLALFTTLKLPLRLSLSGVSVVLLISAFWWTIPEGAFFLLLMSWIFSTFSLTPSGFFWLLSFVIFLALRFASYRFTLSSRSQVFFMVALVAIVFELFQAVMLGQVLSTRITTAPILLSILISAFIQAALAAVFSRHMLRLIEAR